MRKHSIKAISFIMVVFMVLASASVSIYATSQQSQLESDINKLESQNKQLQSEINSLKSQKSKQQELKKALESQIAVLQKQINLCNSEIYKINNTIASNKADIDKKQKEIDAEKLEFKKRIRAIYMSNTRSDIQVLLGAENFSEFLQLSQLTASVSASNKKLINSIVKTVEELNKKLDENNKLLEQQVVIKQSVSDKQKQIESQSNQIQSVINSLSGQQTSKEKQQKENAAEIKAKQKVLEQVAHDSYTGKVVYDGGNFQWPTPGIYQISSPWGMRWGSMHRGIDISNGQWGGKIVAIADGIVTTCVTGCTHDYRKSSSCGCGGGYGNYIAIDHGKGSDGNTYASLYGHMRSVAVSKGQYVKKGQVIGYIGCTGFSTGPHLHLGIMVNKVFVNPELFFKKVK